EENVEIAEIDGEIFYERELQRGAIGAGSQLRNGKGRDGADQRLKQQPLLRAEPLVAHALDLEIVIVKADGAEADGDEQHHPDIAIGEVGPEERRNHRA